MRAGRGLRRARVLPRGHVAAARWRHLDRGPADPTSRRHRVAAHAPAARYGRRRPGARRTSVSPQNLRPGSHRRRDAPSQARQDGGFGRQTRLRRHEERQIPGYVHHHDRRPSADRSRSGCRDASLRPRRAAQAGSQTGSWPTRGTRRPRWHGRKIGNLRRHLLIWVRLPVATGHLGARPGRGALQAPSHRPGSRRRRRPWGSC